MRLVLLAIVAFLVSVTANRIPIVPLANVPAPSATSAKSVPAAEEFRFKEPAEKAPVHTPHVVKRAKKVPELTVVHPTLLEVSNTTGGLPCYEWMSSDKAESETPLIAGEGQVSWTSTDGNIVYLLGGCAEGQCSSAGFQYNVMTHQWSELAIFNDGGDALPFGPVEGVAFAAHPDGKSVYIFGGRRSPDGSDADSDSFVVSNSLNKLSLNDDGKWIWSDISTSGQVPPGSIDATLTFFDDSTLVLFGGFTDLGFFADVYTINTNADSSWEWTKPAVEGAIPKGRRGHTATVMDGVLYVIGGTNGVSSFNDVHVLSSSDKITWTWASVSVAGDNAMPARFFHSAVVDSVRDGRIVVLLGCDPVSASCYDDVYALSKQADGSFKWETHDSDDANQADFRASPRRRAATVVTYDSVVLIGGCSTEKCYNDVNYLALDGVCANSCGEHGNYVKNVDGTGRCDCVGDYSGIFCTEEGACGEACTEHGTCKIQNNFHVCVCSDGYWGVECSNEPCLNNCTGHGSCEWLEASSNSEGLSGSVCKCSPGYMGEDCSVLADISVAQAAEASQLEVSESAQHARFEALTQQANAAGSSSHQVPSLSLFQRKSDVVGSGTGLVEYQCPSSCSGHGSCVPDVLNPDFDPESTEGICDCNDGYAGDDCSVLCPNKCTSSANGVCTVDEENQAVCDCHKGFQGQDCSVTYCAFNCSNNGVCADSKCFCEPPYVGAFCHIDSSCSGNGDYYDNQCHCNDGYGLADCSKMIVCENDCSNNGQCVYNPDSPIDSHGTTESELFSLISQSSCTSDYSGACAKSKTGAKSLSDEEIAGECLCNLGYGGVDCSEKLCNPRDCSEHGSCDGSTGSCECFPGYGGDDCSIAVVCPNNCTVDAGCEAHGVCTADGTCACNPEWTGDDCSQLACPNNCNDQGTCSSGKCICDNGYYGEDCSDSCPKECSEHGVCVDGACTCDPRYEGEACDTLKACPTPEGGKECDGHGICDRPSQTCYCAPGYSGEDCSTASTDCGPNDCNDHGVCQKGLCHCDFGYEGEHCESKAICENDCNGNGLCHAGECTCFNGFQGESCEEFTDDESCPDGCSGKGVCRNGRCFCVEGYSGASCSDRTGFCSTSTCSGHGLCENDQCWCDPGFSGAECETSSCESCAEGKGECFGGQCRCYPGYTGGDCSQELECPGGTGVDTCSGHGVCVQGTCACEPGYAEEDCSKIIVEGPHCPNDCSENGVCFLGKCFCLPGRVGDDCSIQADTVCPLDCTGKTEENRSPGDEKRGECLFGQCFCAPGYSGEGCEEELTCEDNCNDNGVCYDGKCFCLAGWTGDSCADAMDDTAKRTQIEADWERALAQQAADECDCPYQCSNHGLCIGSGDDAQCACEPGWKGEYCEEAIPSILKDRCVDDCHGHGECIWGQCQCHFGWTGKSCGDHVPLPCLDDCNARGVCEFGVCTCDSGWTGASCSEQAVIIEGSLSQLSSTSDALEEGGSLLQTRAGSEAQAEAEKSMNGEEIIGSDCDDETTGYPTMLIGLVAFLGGVVASTLVKSVIDRRDKHHRQQMMVNELLSPVNIG